ncbi:MAG: hypothetical protein QNJ41_19025 [Xenococcaceae cyanobacterium MO_188.B32]|nr:hypothetical protein [Xenococcaceae cyanobacterium MO_188.B32]
MLHFDDRRWVRTRHLWNKTTTEVMFYLSSLPPDAQQLGKVIRLM